MVQVSRSGMYIARPANAAQATASIAPDSQPAGTPMTPKAAPPIVATESVSARCRALIVREDDVLGILAESAKSKASK